MKRLDLVVPILALLPFLLMLTNASLQAASSTDELGLIPAPQHVERLSGEFTFPQQLTVADLTGFSGVDRVISYLEDKLSEHAGIRCIRTQAKPSDKTAALVLTKSADSSLGEEGYRLEIRRNRIEIQAAGPAGLFYGVQTLFQLMPAQFLGNSGSLPWPVKVPCVKIQDRPRYGWRGLMLDVSRHFFPKEFIKQQIDLLAFHKMNRLHLHLTDDQGWRIEIKKYPRLTEISSWRREGDGHIVGGYYTQDDLRELVKYAEDRFVTIVPEIEMPGHCVAALAAYPELSCTGGPFRVAIEWGIHPDVYCAGNDQTFEFLEDVLTEVMDIFPSPYIHVGGDEVPKDRWQHCPKCQARIKAEGLKDEAELQSYFIRRIEKFLNAHGRRLIGWDEILEGGLAPNAVVMSWRGTKGGIAAAQADHDVVMSPTTYCYFDYYQGNPLTEPLAIGGNLPIEKVYQFDPTPAELPPDKTKHILGGQANLWTEYVPTPEQAEYMIYPRLAAMSEDLWSPKEQHSWDSFTARLQRQLQRYEALGLNYARSLFAPELSTEFDAKSKELTV
ncbi:MAG TPA: beta-N-acetylhexosaminidase, partial [Bacteroidetes bacterium]|nr:beta-N-acetylhexosaminidase [Bacteroidota bacterium]